MEKKETTPNKKKNALLSYTLIALAAAVIGVTAGVIVKRYFTEADIDYSGFDPNSYQDDAKELLKQYEANPDKDFTPAELVNIGLEKYRECENSYSIGVGVASTIVSQTTRSAQIKNGNTYFEETISYSSMVSIANRVVQETESGDVGLYKGKASGPEESKYTDNKVTYEKEKYKTDWGKTPNEMFIYLLSNQSVIQNECKIEKENGNIKVTLKLDPETSTYNYKIQMKKISGLDKLPTFEYLTHVYTFTSDMTLLKLNLDEKYKAQMGVTATINNKISYYYHANEYLKIPTLDEKIDYSLKGE